MSSIYIYHHLGMGDHIVANGMVRTIAKKYDNVFLFCKPKYFNNVSFMFRDLKHLRIMPMDDNEIIQFIQLNPTYNYIIAGHTPFWKILRSPDNQLQIDEIFYKLAGVPIENKYSEFYIQRDIEKEKSLFNQLGLSEGEEFAFIHDEEFVHAIETRKIDSNVTKIKIVKPSYEHSIFDYMYTLEKATEIHCINSSFSVLIDCMGIQAKKMYIYDIEKSALEKFLGVHKSKWEII